MRGRNKPWADQFILDHADYLYHQETSFLNNQETYLEVGIGKGDFIIQSCQYYPHVNHIGVELNKSVFAIALKKIVNTNIENVKLLQVPAAQLVELIPHHSISKIFLNFSDPWPKSGYKKRRLVHPFHLQIFEQLLKKDGQIAFKTDNLMLFEFGLESFKERNYEIVELSYDYQTIPGDFISEYEARFRSLNQPIYRCVIKINSKEE